MLDYQEYRAKKNALAVEVPQEELYVESGPPCFRIAFARDRALKEGRDSSVSEFPEIDLTNFHFHQREESHPHPHHRVQRAGGFILP